MSEDYPWTCDSFSGYLADKGFFNGLIKDMIIGEDVTFEDMWHKMLDQASNLDIYLPDSEYWDYELFFHTLVNKEMI